MSQTKSFEADLWIVVKPAEDVAGTWLSHCLNLDLYSQGSSPEHALRSLEEAIAMVVIDDSKHKRDPLQRGEKTPPEDWAEQSRIVQRGNRREFSDLKESKAGGKARWAVNMKYRLEWIEVAGRRSLPQQVMKLEPMPPAWKIASGHLPVCA